MPGLAILKASAYSVFAAHRLQLGPPPQMAQVTYGATSQPQYQQAQTTNRPASTVTRNRTVGVVSGGGGSGASAGGSAGGSSSGGSTTPMMCPPALFVPRSNSAEDVRYQKDQHDYYTGLFDCMIDAIVDAHNKWRAAAFFSDITINAMFATGGRLNGPRLDDMISNSPGVAACTGKELRVRNAVAKGVGEAFKRWQDGVRVPGLPWYPTFVAWPGSQAPPTPNIPTELRFCVSLSVGEITDPLSLSNRMKSQLTGSFDYSSQFFDALAFVLAPAFTAWLACQPVMRVMGHGPVPAYAPPYVPTGTVFGGSVIAAPPHLIG